MKGLDLLNEFWLRCEKKRFHATYAPRVRESRPFTLDDELTEVIGEIAFGGRSVSSAIMRRYVHSARPVFDKMWMECDYERAFGLRTPPESTGLSDSASLFKDVQRIGWLIDAMPGDRGYSAARVARAHMVDESHDESAAALHPIIHLIQRTQDLDYQRAFEQPMNRVAPQVYQAMRDFNQQDRLRRLYWGYGSEDSTLDHTHAVMIEPTFAMTLADGMPDESRLTRSEKLYGDAFAVMQHSLMDQSGEMRFISVALALLAELPVKFTPYRPSGRAMLRGATKPYLGSSVVTIEMPRTRRRIKDIEDKLLRAEAAHRRAHEVIGHYRTSDKPPRAEVLRTEAGEDARWHSYIARDGRVRFRQWIAPHMRGDASIGYVRHDGYEVVRGEGAIIGGTRP